MHNDKLKIFQLKKLKQYFKKTDLIFFFYTTDLNVINQLQLDQKLNKNNLKIYKIKNTLMKHVLNNSVFKNFSVSINGPLCFIKLKNTKKLDIKTLINISPNMPFLGIKLNKRIYSTNQLKTVSTLNYSNNVKILNKTFKRLIKVPYYKIRNSK